jgi:tight adherence protein B
MSNELLMAAVLVFFAAFAAAETLLNWWTSTRGAVARRINKRLESVATGGGTPTDAHSLLKQRIRRYAGSSKGLRSRFLGKAEALLIESGSDWSLSNFVHIMLMAGAAGLMLSILLGLGLLVAVMVGTSAASMPWLLLSVRRQRRRARFEYLMPDALDLIGRALRSGHSFPSALQLAGTELPDPIGEELRMTSDEINFGVPHATALEHLAQRVPSKDLSFFVIAVVIQRETGGNLAEVLDNISKIIRERLKLFGKVRAISAEAKMSAWVLSTLPVVTALLLFLVNPGFMSLLWTEPLGIKMIYMGIASTIVGIFWMRKVIRIHV